MSSGNDIYIIDVLLILGILLLTCNITLKHSAYRNSLHDSVDGLSIGELSNDRLSDSSNVYVKAHIKHKFCTNDTCY